MVSLFDLIGCLSGAAALAILLGSWRQHLSREEKCIVLLVCSLTVLINGQGVMHWWGKTLGDDPSESWADYLQILQPALWGMFFYVVVQAQQRRTLLESRKQMRSIVENMPVILQAYDKKGCLLAWNRHAEETTGFTKEDLIGDAKALERLFPDAQVREQLLTECAKHGGNYRHRVWALQCKQRFERQIAWYNLSEKFPIQGWSNWAIGLDITEQLAAQRELEHKATHDELTGLPNRALLRDRLVHALSNVERNRRMGALLLLDLDQFKIVNDTHGHPVGDRLLFEVGDRLRGYLKSTDTLARLGGDEFVVLLEDVRSPEEVALIAERLISALSSQPFFLFGNEIRVTTSMGVTIFPDDDVRIDELMKNVDMALYAAKEAGRHGYHFYSREMHKKLRWQHKISGQLREALASESFELHFQPQISMDTQKLIGAEALLRLKSLEDMALSPGVFIPIAENMGLMPLLGKWVVERAFQQAAELKGQNTVVPLSINLSPIQFYQPSLIENLQRTAEEYGLSPEMIEFEITESAVMRNMDTSIATMRKLANLGFGISLDDFGTGYSSLSYLKRFPVSKIKIDQSFIQGIETDPADAAIVRSVIDLGHCMKMKVLAEGVESQAQFQHLNDAGCDYMQGYFCSRPLSAANFQRYIAECA